MNNPHLDEKDIIRKIKDQVRDRQVKFTIHAHREMHEDSVSSRELFNMLTNCTILENYPEYRRGPCCLVGGKSDIGRHLHAVCTTTLPDLVIITVYEPTSPKWETPFKREKR